MRRVSGKYFNRHLLRLLLIVPLIVAGLLIFASAGAELPQRSLMISDSTASATAVYSLGFTIPAPETLGSIELQICANSPLVGEPCTAPSGFDISAATLSGQTGETGFTIYAPGTNANTVVLTRAPIAAAAGTVSYTFSGAVNPSSSGTYYGRIQTFASIDASGAENEHGGLAFSMNSTVQISTTVPPYLLFCTGITISGFDCSTASGDYINLGSLVGTATSSADSQMVTATNAANGFGIRVYGTTMTSGNNTINALSVRDVSRPGVSQFGINLAANTSPLVGAAPQGPGSATVTSSYSTPDFFKFAPSDVIASIAGVDDYNKFTASYIINIPHGQAPGVYVSTLQYVCLASF